MLNKHNWSNNHTLWNNHNLWHSPKMWNRLQEVKQRKDQQYWYMLYKKTGVAQDVEQPQFVEQPYTVEQPQFVEQPKDV